MKHLYVEENRDGENNDQKSSSKSFPNGTPNDGEKNEKKPKEVKSVLIKQEERETGVVSLKVLQR